MFIDKVWEWKNEAFVIVDCSLEGQKFGIIFFIYNMQYIIYVVFYF